MKDVVRPEADLSDKELRRRVIDEQFVALQQGHRTLASLLPVAVLAVTLPVVASTRWGAPWFGHSPQVYAGSASLLLIAMGFAVWTHRRFGSLSWPALLCERVESFSALLFCALWVLGPTQILNFGWLAFLIHGLMATTIIKKMRDAYWGMVGTLALAVVVIAIRDGVSSAAGAAVLAGACILPMFPILMLSERALLLEVARRKMQVQLAAAEVELERQRISRGLHDGLSGQLTALLWRLRSLGEQGGGQGFTQELEARVRGCITALRQAIWSIEMRSMTLSLLFERLQASLAPFGAERLRFEVEPSEAVDPATGAARLLESGEAVTLLAAGTELAHNALRYTTGPVAVRLGPGARITVIDQGAGLPATLPEDGGLFALQRRLRAWGGTLESTRDPKGGAHAMVATLAAGARGSGNEAPRAREDRAILA